MESMVYGYEYSPHNVCHLVIDTGLPLFAALKQSNLLGKSPRIVLIKRCRTRPCVPEVYAMLSDNATEYLSEHPSVAPGQIVVMRGQDRSVIQGNSYHWIHVKPVVDDYRRTILRFFGVPESVQPGQITVVERIARRKILNIDQLIAGLSDLGAPIATVRFEEMSFRDQLTTIQQTRLLIAMHGAALTHCIFMHEGAAVIELLPYGFLYRDYSLRCETRELNYLQWHNPEPAKSFPIHTRAFLGSTDVSVPPTQDPGVMNTRGKTGTAFVDAQRVRSWFQDQDTIVDVPRIVDLAKRALAFPVRVRAPSSAESPG